MSFSSFEENWKHGSKVNSSPDRARVKFGNFSMVKAENKSEVSNFSMVKFENKSEVWQLQHGKIREQE